MTKPANYTALGALAGERMLDGLAASAGAAMAIAISQFWLERMSSQLFQQLAIGSIV